MHFTGQVYRHPMEAETPLLEVTIGCSHNKCSFCTMYRETTFAVSPLEDVEADLKEYKESGAYITRLYLVNGEPFVLSTDKLIAIAKLIIQYFPEIETITCYTSIKNLINKSVDDLKLLKEYRYNDLHIGLETGNEKALALMNKGFTVKDSYEQLTKLNEAGLRYDALLMVGVAGKGNSELNVKETATLLNKTQPYMVSVMPTSVTPGSELEKFANEGTYVELTELEMLKEEQLLLQSLELKDAYFFGSHYFNLVPISGHLSDKDKMIAYIDEAIASLDERTLESTKPRGNI